MAQRPLGGVQRRHSRRLLLEPWLRPRTLGDILARRCVASRELYWRLAGSRELYWRLAGSRELYGEAGERPAGAVLVSSCSPSLLDSLLLLIAARVHYRHLCSFTFRSCFEVGRVGLHADKRSPSGSLRPLHLVPFPENSTLTELATSPLPNSVSYTHFPSGYWCTDHRTCHGRMSDTDQTSSKYWQTTTKASGVFSRCASGSRVLGDAVAGDLCVAHAASASSREAAKNPFATANMVYIRYCSSDAWMVRPA
jgi:hypothetical protein